MSGPFKRRPSLKSLPPVGTLALRKSSIRRQSSIGLGVKSPTGTPTAQEVPWDILDRCLLPVIFCHAGAFLISTILNVLHISEVSTLTLFIWFTIPTIAAILCYHNLKVTAAGKAVLVTGCESRVAAALVRLLDEEGFTVFAGFQNGTSSHADDLREVCSGRLQILQLDITSETQILAASLKIVENLPDGAPGLWAVVHATSWVALGEIEWIPPQVIRKATEINFLGPTRVTQIMLPLVRRASGRIVYVTSGMSKIASPVRGVHCALLAALEAQAECLRKELRSRNVDVAIVASGDFTAGTSWLSDDVIVDQARDMWNQLCQEQKFEYGKDYFETAIRSLEKYTKMHVNESELSSVLKALRDAVTRTFPLSKYTPVTRKEKIQVLIADYLPRSIYDIIYA